MKRVAFSPLATRKTLAATTKRSQDPASDDCVRGDVALARAFLFLGKRWNAVVLGILNSRPAGFRELSRAISGISDRLVDLAGAGLIAPT
jgi:DNA-binding HxlR family transcriptional regulator